MVAGHGRDGTPRRQLDLAEELRLLLLVVMLLLLLLLLLSYLVGVVGRWVRVRGRRTGRQADVLLGRSRTNLRPGVVVVYQRRRVNAGTADTSVAGTAIAAQHR